MSAAFPASSEARRRHEAIRARCFHASGSFIPFPREETEQSIVARFEQQVRRYPERIAVKSPTHTLTYEALNRLANRIAWSLLAERGEGAEPIALLMEHDAPLIAAMLGVLKAGKIALPLDPEYPYARLDDVLADSQAAILLTGGEALPLACELARETRRWINLDELDPGLADDNPGLALSPDTFSYLIYTSGSSGRPKGVVENHRNVLHFTMRYTNTFHLCPEDRLPLVASCSFSGSATSIYCSLLNGARLCPLEVKRHGVAHLAQWLADEEITVLISAGMFPQLVEALTGKEAFPRLRLIMHGGTPLPRRTVELYRKHFSPECILVSALGSTEMKNSRQYFIDHQTPITGAIVPVGYPVEDIEVLLLDEAGAPVAPGQVGEITIRSRFIAPGYWRRPELTAAVFRPDPSDGSRRIYHTGDLGRLHPDDCLECLGRKDFQVKLRGLRIETTEVEEALLELVPAREAVVVARTDRFSEQQLVGYFVPDASPVPTVSALRRALAQRLPEAMIPFAFVALDALPRTLTGKVDRNALPAPGSARPELDTPFRAAATPLEVMLATMLAELLGLDQVGCDDTFLELGGDSLMATRLLTRVRATFQEEVCLPDFFAAPSVAGLAERLVAHEAVPGRVMAIARLRGVLDARSAEEIETMLQARWQDRLAAVNGGEEN